MQEAYYNLEDLKDILYLDDLEVDITMTLFKNEDMIRDIFEPIIITKIMSTDNELNAVKYILQVCKNISSVKYESYKKVISEIIKPFILIPEYYNLYNLYNTELKDINYLTVIFDIITQSELFDFITSIKDCDKNQKFALMNILVKSNNIKNHLLNTSSTSKDYELDINIMSFIRLGDDFDINDEGYYEIIKNFTEDNLYKFKLCAFLNDILEKNKAIAHMNCDFSNIASARFIAIVLKTHLLLFQFINKSEIFNNCNKIFSETQRKDYEPIRTDNYETILYLQTLKSTKLLYNYILSGYSALKKMFSTNMFDMLQIQPFKFEILDKIVNSTTLNRLIEELIDYYTSEFLQINNESVDTVIQYYFNIKSLNKNALEYFYKLLTINFEYCNKHYKFDVLTLLCDYFSKLKNHEYKDNIKLLEAIIIYHDENDMFKIEKLPIAHKYYKLSLEILEKIISNSEIEENSMNQIFLKFFYKTNSHNISFIDMLTELCKEISQHVNNYNSSAYRLKFMDMVKTIMNNIYLSLQLVNKIISKKILNPAVFKGEIILPIITLATNVIKYFTDGKIAIYNIFNMNFEALDIMKESLYILHKLIVNDEFKELIQETKDIIIETLPYIKFHDNELYIKEELKHNIEYQKGEIKLDNIPEDFLDPLIYTLIREPVMIPNVDLMFDKSSIMSQIYHEKINPYTREFLDEEILKVYNDNPKIKEQVHEFLVKFNQWKNQNV
jgi:hypothetical protein